MSQLILNVLCEGHTENRFAQKVLKPYLDRFGIVVKTQLLLTSKKKDVRGGMLSYGQAKTDLTLWIKQHSGKTYEEHHFTTMFDLYKLPCDFPGYENKDKIIDCYALVQHLEKELGKDINFERFVPYIQLHEFEALVFCGLEYLLIEYPDMNREVERLKREVDKYDGNPEKINNSPETAPSKRIDNAFKSKHRYNKPKLGELVTEKVGIDRLKEQCPHFKEWMNKLENIGAIRS